MRRPLICITISLMTAIMVSHFMGWETAVGVVLALLAAYFVFGKKERSLKRGTVLVITAYTIGTGIFLLDHVSYEKDVLPVKRDIEITGLVKDMEWKKVSSGSNKLDIRLEIQRACSESADNEHDVLISYYIDDSGRQKMSDVLNPGDSIIAGGQAELPQTKGNPRCFDYRMYLKTIGIKYIFKADHIDVLDHSGKASVLGKLYGLKVSFLERLRTVSGKSASDMMGAIMFGSEKEMDEETLEEFRKNGTAHILAVSGLHIGIIYGCISWLWRWKKGRVYFAAVMFFFLCYCVMSSFAISVIRAVIMIGLNVLARICNRRYDLLSAALFAATAMMIKEPMYLFNTGFQMSFIAILTIAVILPVVKSFYKGVFLASLSVQIGLAPYIAYTFNYISLGAVLVNIPIIFLAGLILPSGLFAMSIMGISDELFYMLAKILSGLCRMLTELNHMTAVDGITVFQTVSPDIRLMIVYYIVIAVLFSEEGRLMIKRRRKNMAMAISGLLAVTLIVMGQSHDLVFEKSDVVFVDVGQGDCMHLRTEDGRNYLIDGGGSINYNVGKKVLKPYLLKNGVRRLDGVFVTHMHSDHYKGIKELCNEDMVKELFLYEGNVIEEKKILRETCLEKADLNYLHSGQKIKLSDDMSIDVMWPEKRSKADYKRVAEEDDENKSSLIFMAEINDYRILATGDIDEACQKTLVNTYGEKLKCNVLKVPHHGSKYSYCDEFTEAAAPDMAVFQVGKNNFGHPDKGVVENYRRNGIMIYRNDKHGAVGLDFQSDSISVMTMRKVQNQELGR